MSSGMNTEQAKVYAENMTYSEAVSNVRYGKGVRYRKATMIKLHELAEIADRLDKNFKGGLKMEGNIKVTKRENETELNKLCSNLTVGVYFKTLEFKEQAYHTLINDLRFYNIDIISEMYTNGFSSAQVCTPLVMYKFIYVEDDTIEEFTCEKAYVEKGIDEKQMYNVILNGSIEIIGY